MKTNVTCIISQDFADCNTFSKNSTNKVFVLYVKKDGKSRLFIKQTIRYVLCGLFYINPDKRRVGFQGSL